MAAAVFSGDIGLITSVLIGAELQDWCALAAVTRWSRDAVRDAKAPLRDAVMDAMQGERTCWERCRLGDVTGLWALLDEGLGLCRADGGPLLCPRNRDSILHAALRAHGRPGFAKLFSWVVSLPGAAASANTRNVSGYTAAHVCASDGLWLPLRRLLKVQGVGTDGLDNYERTPLLVAVDEQRPAIVGTLLAAGSNPNTFVPNCHGHGETALVTAVRLGNANIVRQLLRAPGIDLHQKTIVGVPFGKTAMDFAPARGPVRELLDAALAKDGGLGGEWAPISAPPMNNGMAAVWDNLAASGADQSSLRRSEQPAPVQAKARAKEARAPPRESSSPEAFHWQFGPGVAALDAQEAQSSRARIVVDAGLKMIGMSAVWDKLAASGALSSALTSCGWCR